MPSSPISWSSVPPAVRRPLPHRGDAGHPGRRDRRPTNRRRQRDHVVRVPSAVGSGSWSRHAYGLAVDVNPFHNPYLKGDLVLPELATAYLDRANHRPGMIQPGDVAVEAFAAMGWPWGGNWNTLLDYMHFSDNGR